MEWEEFKKKRFKENPKLKEEYDKLELEYKIKKKILKGGMDKWIVKIRK